MGGIMTLHPHDALELPRNPRQSAPSATELDTNIYTPPYATERQLQRGAGLPQYHINGVELRWSLVCDIIPQYPIQITELRDTSESTVIVRDRTGLDQLVMHVKRRRYEDYLEKHHFEPADIFGGLSLEEKQRDEIFEGCVVCDMYGDCEDEDGDEGEEADVGAHIFVQVDVLSATGAVGYEDDEDAAIEVDERVGVIPCVGRQYVWQA